MVADRSYFVTFRLKGSIPQAVAIKLRQEREALQKRNDPTEMNEWQREAFVRIEAILDASKNGATHLDHAPLADIVFNAFHWLEERGWLIHALTVMPNHVHVLTRNTQGQNHLLNHHLGILKGWTAREANRLLDRKGSFWMDENFDHWCRTQKEIESLANYIVDNPVKAGLVDSRQKWPWTRADKTYWPEQAVAQGENCQAGMPDIQ